MEYAPNKKATRVIHVFEDTTQAHFARGKFDDWCVFVTDLSGNERPPLDTEYFAFFQDLAKRYGPELVYRHFRAIYELTTTVNDPVVPEVIRQLSLSYKPQDRLSFRKNLVVIYGGMVAEENKANAILKKKIKKIGFFQSVVLGWDVEKAANWSRGQKATELSAYYAALVSGERPDG